MPDAVYTVHEFFQSAVVDFPFWKTDLRPKLESALAGYLGRQASLALRPTIQTIEEWLAQQLVVSFCAEAAGALTPLQSMGDGWQALVRLAALEVLQYYPEAVKNNVMLLYEEPETYLHPHLCRKLRNVLGRLASTGWTVIASTHAPEFVNFTENQQITRLWRLEDGTMRGQLSTDSLTDAVRFQEKLDERGTHEFLFANRVVFCEGKDDVFALRLYLGKKRLDLDGLGVTILDVGGSKNHPDYVGMAKRMGIPWCALTDEDLGEDGKPNPITEKVRKNLLSVASKADIVPFWPISLEKCFGLNSSRKATPDWQEENLSPKSLTEIVKEFPNYVAACEQILSWLK